MNSASPFPDCLQTSACHRQCDLDGHQHASAYAIESFARSFERRPYPMRKKCEQIFDNKFDRHKTGRHHDELSQRVPPRVEELRQEGAVERQCFRIGNCRQKALAKHLAAWGSLNGLLGSSLGSLASSGFGVNDCLELRASCELGNSACRNLE